jgi:hypothetical protein
MISGMKITEGNRHDSSQRYFDGILARACRGLHQAWAL